MTGRTEFLNVDEIAPKIKKTITFKGETYEFRTPTVDDFIEEMSEIKKLQALQSKTNANDDAAEIMVEITKLTRSGIKRCFPTMSDEVLGQMSMDQMNAVRVFIQDRMEDAAEGAEDEAGNGSATQEGSQEKPE